MQNVKLLRDKFEFPKDFRPEDYFDKNIGIWLKDKQKYKVELLISKEIGTFALEHTLNENQEIRQDEDGSVFLSFESN